jgi:hypothetical protein
MADTGALGAYVRVLWTGLSCAVAVSILGSVLPADFGTLHPTSCFFSLLWSPILECDYSRLPL